MRPQIKFIKEIEILSYFLRIITTEGDFNKNMN